jgi:antitoxin (DNA-binding transcriptional repressor) of toxin-antitoxin stability system
MATYEVEVAADLFEELVARANGGEVIGLTRDGRLVAILEPVEPMPR